VPGIARNDQRAAFAAMYSNDEHVRHNTEQTHFAF
jgi:hypothetical protein